MVGNNNDKSAWTCGTCAYRKHGDVDECYFHNFLTEMPDLNLKNDQVINELKVLICYAKYIQDKSIYCD